MHTLQRSIRDVPDFPKKGIVFKDITTLLGDSSAFHSAVDFLADKYRGAGIDKVVCVESRGFIVGAALAYRLGVGFVPIRKKGKLPAATVREEYTLEYGTDTMEIHADALKPKEKVLLHDDLLATGGTMAAACRLVEKLGATIAGIAFLIELRFLKGRNRIGQYDVYSIIEYDSE